MATVFLARLDGAWIASELNRNLLAEKQRVLKIDGPLNLHLYPALSVEVHRLALSEQDSEAIFASLETLRLSLQWWPLLSRRAVIDTLELDGLSVVIARDAQGRYNFANLLESRSGGPWTFDIARLQLNKARLLWRDPQHAQGITLDKVDLSTGRIGNAQTTSRGQLDLAASLHSPDSPRIEARVKIKTQYTLSPADAHYRADELAVQLNGRWAEQPNVTTSLVAKTLVLDARAPGKSLKLSGLQWQAQATPGRLSLTAPQVDLLGDRLQVAALGLQLQSKIGQAEEMSLDGQLDTSLSADLAARSVVLDKLTAALTLNLPQQLARPVVLSLHGAINADLPQQQLTARLAGKLNDSQIDGKLAAQGWNEFSTANPATLRFTLAADRFNADDYLRSHGSSGSSSSSSSNSSNSANTAPQTLTTSSSAMPSLPSGLDLQGELKIGHLQMAGVNAHKLRLAVATHDGHLQFVTMPR